MVAINGGTFLMGSPLDEEHRNLDEGPQREITISPFWMGKFEVSWDQFRPMHGNVIEWCLDAYSPTNADLPKVDPWRRATQRFGRVVRGGSWYDPAEYCRSAARDCSNENWIMQDPQIPKSLWWQTDAQWLGFRIVRPVEVPDDSTMYEIWNSAGVHPQPGDKKFELR